MELASEIGAAKAATLVIQAITPFVKEHINDPVKLALSLEPLYGFAWSRGMIVKIGSKPLNDILKLVKSSALPKEQINRLRKLIKTAYFDQSGTFPPKWELWREIIAKYHLYEVVPFGDWAKIIWKLEDHKIYNPLDLAELSKEEAKTLESVLDSKGNSILLWQTVLCWNENNPTKKGMFRAKVHKDVYELVHSLRFDHISETPTFKAWLLLRNELGLPASYEDAMPRERIRALARSDADPTKIEEFLRLGTKINILRNVASSMRCVSSGINSYAAFCALTKKPIFPPTEDTVLMWGSTFKPGRTYTNYVSHLRKGCFLAESTLDWHTLAVKEVAKGLRAGQYIPFKFPNFLYTQDLFRIINSLGWEDVFTQLAFLAYLFSLRIPSEALFLKRAFSNDRINEFVPQADKALIGTRTFQDVDCLIIKLSRRKNLAGGCLLRRPCICSVKSASGRRLCPPHAFWPLVSSRCGPGELIFPNFSKHNVNRILKTTLMKIGFEDGSQFTSKAFRRGATQELLTTGNSLEVIKGSGGWLGPGFRSYVDLGMDSAFRISKLLVELSDDDSSDDERIRLDKEKRKRWRKAYHKTRVEPPSSLGETSDSA